MAEEKQKLVDGVAGRSLVEVNPKPCKGLASKATDFLEKLFVKLMYDSSNPQHYLSGNFAPVHQETPPIADLPVKGHLPECLNGEFVRVGPNPKFSPVAGYHWYGLLNLNQFGVLESCILGYKTLIESNYE